MKYSKTLSLTLAACLFGVCCSACSTAESSGAKGSETSESTSEKAMKNFVNKLNAGNYVIDADGYMKTTVYSPDQVYFSYYGDGYGDYGFFTLNGDTFRAMLEGDAVSEVEYISSENAAAIAEQYLPTYWNDFSEGNMFNLFFGSDEKPLEFVSYDSTVKTTLLRLAGYGQMALSLMQEVYMTFDAEDPKSVHFTAVVDDNPAARIYFDDLDLTLEFGNAVSDARIGKWLKSPVYPETKTAWTEGDIFYFNSVFFPGYGEDSLPFPEFASFALRIDEEVFDSEEKIYMTDSHASEKDVEDYKAALLANGFSEAKQASEEGGEITVYRRVLREDYNCYISAYPFYDNGFAMLADRYYDNPVYDSLAGINETLKSFGFEELPENEHLSDWSAVDKGAERSESWLYFFDYDISLDAAVHYDDAEQAMAYLEDYADKLREKGYEVESTTEEAGYEEVKSADGCSLFRYKDNGDGTAALLFRHEKNPPADEISAKIRSAGFPEIRFQGNMTSRDLSRYHKLTRTFKGLFLAVSQPFDSTAEAEAYLDAYVASLEQAGYDRENPAMIGSLKQNAYYNETEDKYVAFDYFPEEGNALITFDFVAN